MCVCVRERECVCVLVCACVCVGGGRGGWKGSSGFSFRMELDGHFCFSVFAAFIVL